MNPRSIMDYFTYELDFSSLAAAAQATSSFLVQADSDFRWMSGVVFADIAAAIQTDSSRVIPLCTVLIQDTGSGRNLMSAAVPIANLFGSGTEPFILPIQRDFRSNSQVSVTVTNFSPATTYNLRLSFIGAKIYSV